MIAMVKKESSYLNYITGKRVIFVGPGSIMRGRGLGDFIDSYDVVIRTNHFPILMESDSSLINDYGEKCSVVYLNLHYYRNNRPLKLDIYKNRGVRWLCSKVMNPVDMRVAGKIFNVRTINHVANYLHKMIGDALMGSVIIHDIVSQCPAELFVTGIDFFLSRDDNYGSYASPDYISDSAKAENIKRDIGQGKGHNLPANARYMLSMHDQGYFKTHDFILEKIKKVAS